VTRPRLVERINAGLNQTLTLISAPAGFGKTTLLADWARQSERSVAWLTLDAQDNEPVRFWVYLVTALRTILPGLGEDMLTALQSPGPAAIPLLLAEMINGIAECGFPFVLVLDGLHLITDSAIHASLVSIVENLPPEMHLILSSRADPPWPLARLRGRAMLTEVRAAALRFTLQETELFLNTAMGLGLTSEEITALDRRIEGWITGLQMAAISMLRYRRQGAGDLGPFIPAFTGSHRFFVDYLVEEVLDQQPALIREFLLHTSILERMTAPLCDAILDRTGSEQILEELERANLFVVPLDEQRCWYRYHPLFADLLRHRLTRKGPEVLAALHARARTWCTEMGLPDVTVPANPHCLVASTPAFVTEAPLSRAQPPRRPAIRAAGQPFVWRATQRNKIGDAPGDAPLVEPLTERELEILQFLNTNLSSKEIGRELYISVHTVRSHVKSIYGKLGVHSRVACVDVAEELALL
jgi:LuxR family maltose regulon positive regulatory protein